jgi:hypothetical protein
VAKVEPPATKFAADLFPAQKRIVNQVVVWQLAAKSLLAVILEGAIHCNEQYLDFCLFCSLPRKMWAMCLHIGHGFRIWTAD